MSPAPAPPPPDDDAPRRSLRARLVVAVGPDDVGERVTLRYLLRGTSPSDDGALMTDVVGHLRAWGPFHATVRRRTGEDVDVPLDRLVAGKVVPAAPSR